MPEAQFLSHGIMLTACILEYIEVISLIYILFNVRICLYYLIYGYVTPYSVI